ncbi:MAG: hypothetical protein JWO38_4800 [Gemmataceae bacterium]|nr:hypothetical protein [Gemmataceae bacterium]
MSTFRITRWAATAVAAVGLVGMAALAQPPRPGDPIDAARAAQRIADQKARGEVATAILEADRLARTNPVKALQSLRAAQAGVNDSASLGGETRKALTAQLQAKIAAIEGKPALNPGARPDPNAATVKATKQAVYDAYFAEIKAVREGVDRVKRYQDLNYKTEADREIADLTRKFPNNPAVISLTHKDSFANNLADSRLFTKMQGERILLAQNDLMRSSLPPKGDIEFPPDWKEKTKRRSTDVQLTAKERAIIEALDKPVTLAVQDKPLDYVLEELSTAMNQPLFIDKVSLTDLGVDLKKNASVDAKGISARTALRQILGAQGLTFVVKGETIQVMTVEKARDTLVTRVYYLGDLVQGVGPFGGALTWGPFLDYEQTMANVQLVTDSIQASVDPLSWKAKGGPCTITFHYPSMSLIVRASSEVHATLGSKLGGR